MGRKAVVFDLDGVLYDLVATARTAYLVERTGLDPEVLAGIFRSPFEAQAESGAHATGAEYLAAFNQTLGTSLTRAEWVEARRVAMRPRGEMLALVAEVAAQVPVGLLTNNGALLREALPELAPPLCQLLGPRCWVSCDLGARKPDPAVFERVAARLALPAGDILFVDDSAANCEGARTAGMQAWHHRDSTTTAVAVRGFAGLASPA